MQSAVLAKIIEKFKILLIFKNRKNLKDPDRCESIKNQKKKSFLKSKIKENQEQTKVLPQWSRHFVDRLIRLADKTDLSSTKGN